jgi:hypothetical protein
MKSKALIARESRVRKKQRGLCRDCGKSLDRLDRTRCLVCRQKNQESIEKVQQKRIASGLCPNHGIKAIEGYENCFKCTQNHRRVVYGLTSDEFDKRLIEQDGRCAICLIQLSGVGHSVDAPRVDHDHLTGMVRKILCGSCNTGLGKFKDNFDLLQRASDYLKSFSEIA